MFVTLASGTLLHPACCIWRAHIGVHQVETFRLKPQGIHHMVCDIGFWNTSLLPYLVVVPWLEFQVEGVGFKPPGSPTWLLKDVSLSLPHSRYTTHPSPPHTPGTPCVPLPPTLPSTPRISLPPALQSRSPSFSLLVLQVPS